MQKFTTAHKGKIGEDATAQKLQSEGFCIIARNYRKPFGEVDIIAQKKDLLIFVEVKLRTKKSIDLAELIRPSKQKKMFSVAKEFLSFHTKEELTYRFDVSLVTWEPNNQIHIDYIPHAFSPDN